MRREFVLFVAQDGHFGHKALLMPAAEFLAVRGEQWHTMKAACISAPPVDNLLYVKWQRESVYRGTGMCGVQRPVSAPWLGLWAALSHYAERGADQGFLDESDEHWLRDAVSPASGFDASQLYVDLRNVSQLSIHGKVRDVTIVDGILCLDKVDE